MLNVVFASDNNYVPVLGVAITSLIKNNQDDFEDINIFILDDGITSKNKKKIENLINNPNHKLYFIKTKNLDDLKINLLSQGENSNISFTTYSRLFISSLLPQDIDKIIYLDCDVLIVGSFKELWMENIDDYYCGAVLGQLNDFYKTCLDFKLEDNYINAGVLFINLKKWRQDNVEEKFINFMVENQNRFYQHDEGVLNHVFKDQFLILPPKYNFHGRFQMLDYDLARKYVGMKGEYYSKDIINHAKQNPVCLHFIGTTWIELWSTKLHPYRSLYEKYADCAGFKDELIKKGWCRPLSFGVKLIYNSINNPFFKVIIKIVPTSFIHKRMHDDTIRIFEEYEKTITEKKEG